MAARDLVHDLRKLGREAQQVPVQQREAPPPTSDAPALADAVRAAVAPLEAALEREQAPVIDLFSGAKPRPEP